MTTTKIANLKGDAVELQLAGDYVQWRIEGSTGPWVNLLPLADIQGLPGADAIPGDDAVGGWVSTAGTSATKTALETRYGTTMHAPQYGVVGDGSTDDATALQALLDAAAPIGASVTLKAGSVVLIGTTITPPSGTRLYGNGATIKKSAALTDSAFTISGKSNITIEGLNIDGQRALFTMSEFQHGIYIINGSSNITIRDVTTFDNNGDGVYVGEQTAASSNITLENVISSNNTRQALTISHVSGFKATNCRFLGAVGTNPQAGVDIEPNSASVVCENIKFTACTFSGDTHFGMLVSLSASPTAHQGGIDLIGCVIIGNGVTTDSSGGGVNLRESRDFTMVGGIIRGNTGPGVLIDHNTVSIGTKFVGVSILDNTRQGVLVSTGFDDLTISGCTIRGNGVGNPGSYPAVALLPTVASTNVRFVGNSVEGAAQRYGLQTNASVSSLVTIGNTYKSNSLGARALADDAATRLDLDRGQGTAVTGAKGGNAALTSLIARLVAVGIITDSTSA